MLCWTSTFECQKLAYSDQTAMTCTCSFNFKVGLLIQYGILLLHHSTSGVNLTVEKAEIAQVLQNFESNCSSNRGWMYDNILSLQNQVEGAAPLSIFIWCPNDTLQCCVQLS